MRRRGGARLPAWPAPGLLLLCAACVACSASEPLPELTGETAAVLAPGEVHRYRLPLAADRFLRLTVEQEGIDVEVALRGPDGSEMRVDRQTEDHGPELVLIVSGESGPHVLEIRAFDYVGPGRYAARIDALRPATAADRRLAALYRRFLDAKTLHDPAAKLDELAAVAGALRRAGAPELAAEVLVVRARHLHLGGDHAAAAADNAAAAELFAAAGNRLWEMLARANRGDNLLDAADTGEAVGELTAALALAGAEGHTTTVARAHDGLGKAHRWRGELQLALDHYRQALAALPADDTWTRPGTLHNLGVLHARFLGDPERGRRRLTEARDGWALPGRATYKASTLGQLATLAMDDGRPQEAVEHLRQALELRGETGCGRAVLLARLALAHARLGDGARARATLDEALADLARQPCPRTAADLHRYAADLHLALGDTTPAVITYRRCAGLYAAQGDRNGRAVCLAGMARAERARGDRHAALEASRQVLEIVEGVRPTVLRSDLRTSYFAGNQAHVDLHVELLLDLGRDEEAWLTAERGRARVLRDLLWQAGGGAPGSVPAALVERRRRIQGRLNALEERRQGLAETDSGGRGELRRRIDGAIEELERLRGEIRRHGGAAAGAPPTLAELRRQLDGDALLLEVRLGATGSALWAVDRDSLAVHRLPPRRQVEAVAREAAHWLSGPRWPDRNPAPLCELSRLLLAPVADRLAARPLLLVPDGALEAVSFAALPDPAAPGPCRDAPPLVARHDLSYLPSAATLAEQRRRLAGRPPAEGWLAVVADPLYGPADERIPAADRGAGDGPPARLERLPWAGAEAEAILAGLPAGRTFLATGAAASRDTVLAGRLDGHRVVHFATHGVLHARRPLWLSHLALSRLDGDGTPVDGALYAHEIHRLELPAELVVLSACDTALGRQVRGEGLVAGLPRAFLSAGAARVVVSLWAVDDRSTRDLMVGFYDGLLEGGLPPGRALAEAQRTLWRRGLPPHHWAGFVLQGDPRPLPPFAP